MSVGVKLINERLVSVMGESVILGCFDVAELFKQRFFIHIGSFIYYESSVYIHTNPAKKKRSVVVVTNSD